MGEAGYILHTRSWRDTSLLLEVVLRESGRRGVIARGARSNMRQRGRLQPFRPLWLELAGRGELAQLRSVEEMHALPALRGRVLACGYYLNELLMRLLPRDDAHPNCSMPMREHSPPWLAAQARLRYCVALKKNCSNSSVGHPIGS